MTKRISQASTAVVPATQAHVVAAQAAAVAHAAIAAAAAEAAEVKADVKVAEKAEAAAPADAVVALVAPAPLAMVAEPAAAVAEPAAASSAVQENADGDTDYTPYIVGGVLLAGGIAAIALSGGDDNKSTPTPTPTPTPTNTAPTFTSGTTATTPENVATTAAVYTATATDAQSNTITYTIGGTDAALFNINASTGAVTFKASPNFEATPAKTSYSFTVTATDNAATPLGTTQTVTLSLTNVNEAPSFATATTTASIAENSPITTTVLTAAATDPDAGTALTYTLTGTDAALFAINSTTGVVTFRASPDFESTTHSPAYSFNVVASDAATGGLTATQAVTVNVTDVAEAGAGTVLVGTQNLSAAGGNVAYTESAATANTSTITGFAVGDTITVDVATSNYSFSNNGADLLITYAANGIANSITLVGAVPAASIIFSEASAEAAVGSNFFLAGTSVPAPPSSTVVIDAAGALPTYSAANAAVTYTENAGAANNTTITGFGADDKIVVQGVTSGYSFTNNGADLIISFAANGIASTITLTGAVSANAIIFNEASAEAAATGVGADFFRYG